MRTSVLGCLCVCLIWQSVLFAGTHDLLSIAMQGLIQFGFSHSVYVIAGRSTLQSLPPAESCHTSGELMYLVPGFSA